MTFVVVSALQYRRQGQNTITTTALVPVETRTLKLERITDELLYLTKLKSMTTQYSSVSKWASIGTVWQSQHPTLLGPQRPDLNRHQLIAVEKLGIKYLRLISLFI
ncbi:LOW QUALITY PROTEIN: hypothetical protein TorRG33x02_004500 [Trema orientale]|uniref:Uncharacterized protein n=1 Tax=Trema orientale TaxID=63057 RepID=A0A2P5G288_TREOI|nr:LOW QUALITY PROTEIN: hypothetical protein TorRG33x02_004500 [Trema orientale]